MATNDGVDGPRRPEPATRVRTATGTRELAAEVTSARLATGDGVIGLIVPDTGNPFYAEYALAVEQAALRQGLRMLIANSGGDPVAEQDLVADLSRRRLEGLVVASAGAPSMSRGFGPRAGRTVFIDASTAVPGHHTIGVDRRRGAREAVLHLLGHGHETVALLTTTTALDALDGTEEGWRDALTVAGRPLGPTVTATLARGGYVAGRRLLAGARRPSAVLAGSDLLALGLLRAAWERGLSVPDELAVIGFDGIRHGAYCWPPLTSVRQPVTAMADAAVAAVTAPAQESHASFSAHLVVRRSCGCPASVDPDDAWEEPAEASGRGTTGS